MRSIGVTHFRMKSDLQEWLQLSTTKNIPISLLIMSRAFSLTTSDEPEEVLKSSVSSLDSDTINEVVVASAKVGEEKTIDMQKRKLESLKFQEEVSSLTDELIGMLNFLCFCVVDRGGDRVQGAAQERCRGRRRCCGCCCIRVRG